MKNIFIPIALIASALFVSVFAISSCASTEPPTSNQGEGLVKEHFLSDGLKADISETPCTLSNGTSTTCYKIEIRGVPSDHKVGPFCPRTINDSADTVGIWFHDGKVWDVDGAFIKGLATRYNDTGWKLYDEATGNVNVTTTKEACEAAARPNVDPQYQNHCVECSLDYVNGGVPQTVLIPKNPVALSSPAQIDGRGDGVGVGIALNGAHFDPPAPLDAILGAKTIAAFDDCGGHINPVAGYHYHAAMGCGKQIAQTDGHAPLIGYAKDGYAIHAMAATGEAEPTDLDSCRGHTDTVRGYHYHAASPAENRFIGCFHGATASQ